MFTSQELLKHFKNNFHVCHDEVFEIDRDSLVLVKGRQPGSRLLKKAHRISGLDKDRAGRPIKVLSKEMREVFGTFGGKNSLQRSNPRWVKPEFVATARKWVLSRD